jgi:hypothetical protein
MHPGLGIRPVLPSRFASRSRNTPEVFEIEEETLTNQHELAPESRLAGPQMSASESANEINNEPSPANRISPSVPLVPPAVTELPSTKNVAAGLAFAPASPTVRNEIPSRETPADAFMPARHPVQPRDADVSPGATQSSATQSSSPHESARTQGEVQFLISKDYAPVDAPVSVQESEAVSATPPPSPAHLEIPGTAARRSLVSANQRNTPQQDRPIFRPQRFAPLVDHDATARHLDLKPEPTFVPKTRRYEDERGSPIPAPQQQAPDQLEIQIGRIEVTAVTAAPLPERPPRPSKAPSLAEYLKLRDGALR